MSISKEYIPIKQETKKPRTRKIIRDKIIELKKTEIFQQRWIRPESNLPIGWDEYVLRHGIVLSRYR